MHEELDILGGASVIRTTEVLDLESDMCCRNRKIVFHFRMTDSKRDSKRTYV